MKPKLNKLITLLLLLGMFAFVTEAEQRVTAAVQKELSKWVSLLPVKEQPKVDSINPYAHNVSLLDMPVQDNSEKVNPVNN